LRRALVLVPGDAPFSDGVAEEIADALNVKALEPVTSLEGLLDYSVVPNFRALGPKVGKRVPLVKDALTAADGATVHRALDEQGTYELELGDGSSVTLGPDDIEVRVHSHEELVLAEDAGYAVALDSRLDDDLRAEGIARDFIRAINDRRRELDFDIADRIRVSITATGHVEAAAHRHREWIAREVLALELDVRPGPVERADLEIDGEAVALEISRA
jgi:isoleucyl-tRNA synthetase